MEPRREVKPIRSETFWSAGKPPKVREPGEKKIIIPKKTDKTYCVLKYEEFDTEKPSECSDHGIISGPDYKEPPPPPEMPAKIRRSLEMNRIQSRRLEDCDTHGGLKIPIFVEAEVIETIDKWDVRRSTFTLPCGYGHQPLCWLGQSACIRVAFAKAGTYLTIDLEIQDGVVLDVNKPIREVLRNGAQVIIDYASGPRTFREPWEGRSAHPSPKELIEEFLETMPKGPLIVDVPPSKIPPPKKKKKKKGQEDPPPPPPPPPPAPLQDPDNTGNPLPPEDPPPPQFFEVEVQTPVDIITFIDWPAYGIPELLMKVMEDKDEAFRNDEFMVAQEILRSYSGGIQAMILWFSGQGKELEDKDFGVLNLEQFQNLFRVMKLSPVPFTENKLKLHFEKYVPINNPPGCYHLSSWGFFPVMLHLHSATHVEDCAELYKRAPPAATYSEKIYHFIVDELLPNFATEIKSNLEDLHSAEIPESMEALDSRKETAIAALRLAIPDYVEPKVEPEQHLAPDAPTPGLPDLSSSESKAAAVAAAIQKAEAEATKGKTKSDEPQMTVFANAWTQVDLEVDVRLIMPHLKKWLALGEHWDDFLAAAISIYALQTPLDIFEFSVKTADLRFGVKEIQRFLLAASHCIYKVTPLVRVSEHSFLRTHLQQVFVNAKVAKPPYSTYEEKLEYLRQQCFRHEPPLPTLPLKKKGFR